MGAFRLRMAVALIGAVTARAELTWHRAQLHEVTVYSDGPEKELANFTVNYAAFYAALNAVAAPPGMRCPPSTVILFKKRKTLQSYGTSSAALRADQLNSLVSQFDENSVTALALDYDSDEAQMTLYQSDASWMLQEMGLFIPLSVRQGTGEYFSTFHLKGDEGLLGQSDARFENRDGVIGDMDWKKFFAVTTESPEYGLYGHVTNGVYFTQAWELMHGVFSAANVAQSRERFRRLLDLLETKDDPMAAFAAFYGTTPDNLGWAASASVGTKLRLPFDRAAAQRALKMEPAPESDVRAQLFELLVTRDRLRAEVQLDQARRLNPHSAVVELSQAHLALIDGDELEATRLFRCAIADGAHDANAYYYSGKARLDDDIGNGQLVVAKGGDGTLQAIAELRQSLALRSASGRVYLQLARAYLAAPSITAATLSDLPPGLANRGIAGNLKFLLGVLDRRVHDRPGARRLFRQLVDDPRVAEAIRAQAQGQLDMMARAAQPNPPPAVVSQPSPESRETEVHHAAAPSPPCVLQDVTFRTGSEQWGGFRGYLGVLAQKVENQLQVPDDPKAIPFHGQIGVSIYLSSDGIATERTDPLAPPGTSLALLAACRAAVKQAGPFDAWDPDMTDHLGDRQPLIVQFNFY